RFLQTRVGELLCRKVHIKHFGILVSEYAKECVWQARGIASPVKIDQVRQPGAPFNDDVAILDVTPRETTSVDLLKLIEEVIHELLVDHLIQDPLSFFKASTPSLSAREVSWYVPVAHNCPALPQFFTKHTAQDVGVG